MKKKIDINFGLQTARELTASTMVMLAFDLVEDDPTLAPSDRTFQVLETARQQLGSRPLAECLHALRECTFEHKLEYVRHVAQAHLNKN